MPYFYNFPKVEYDVRGNGITQTMTDITRRVRLKQMVKNNNVTFDFYDVKSGETPEYIASEFYGDPQLHWIILMANDITDVYTQWPMSTVTFERFVKEKYDDVDGIHRYEYTQESGDTKFTIELPNESATTIPVGALAITNYQYEEKLQESRRRIRLVQKRYIDAIKKEFRSKING